MFFCFSIFKSLGCMSELLPNGLNYDTRISVGFLNHNVENSISIYKEAFDDVLVVNSGEASTLASLPGDVDGYISICGYGSFLSGRLTGFRRLFSVVGAFFFTHGITNLKTQEMDVLSAVPCQDETIVITVFDNNKTELKNKKEAKDQIKILLLDV